MTLKNGTSSSIPETVLELIYEAASDETKWTDALFEIATWVGAAGAMYCLLDSRVARPQVRALYSSGFAAAANTSYADKDCLVDPHMQLGNDTPLQTWFFSQDHFDRNFISRSAFFQEVMNPLGVRWVAGSRIWEAENSIACLAVQRPLDACRFAKVDRDRLTAVTAHLGRATRIHDRLRNHAFEAGLGVEATDALRFGVVLLDPRAHIMYSNAAADRLLAKSAIFRTTSANCITLAHAGCQAELAAAIAAAANLSSTALRIVDRDGKPVLNALVLPLPASARWNNAWQRPLAMLTMNEIHQPQAIAAHVLQQLFGLTPTEAGLANWLTTGRSIKEYADERGVSIATARTQLKTILSKTDMRRQVELVAYLAKLPPY